MFRAFLQFYFIHKISTAKTEKYVFHHILYRNRDKYPENVRYGLF